MSNSSYYWDMIINLEETKNEIEAKLPDVSEPIFNEYSLVMELLGVLYERVGGLQS